MTPETPKVLLIDDDQAFCQVLARALQRDGMQIEIVHDCAGALAAARQWQPTHAVLDLKLSGADNGLDLIEPLLNVLPDLRIVVLTGYASIATTVTAVKHGAATYLAKPVDAAMVADALLADAREKTVPGERMSLKRLEWEHIQRVLAEHDGNVSAAARTLGLYRRTLQRKLEKRPVRD